LLWYRVENRATFQILAGTFFPVEIVSSAFKVAGSGKSAELETPNARVTWHAIGNAVGIRSGPDEHREYARATAEGVVAGYKISAAVTWLEPMLHVDLTYSEIMEGHLRDPVYRGLVGG